MYALLQTAAAGTPAADTSPLPAPVYTVSRSWPLGGAGGWDYLALEASGARLFISRGDRVDVVETVSGKLAGTIPNTAYLASQQIAQLSQQLKATEELIGQINDQVRYSEALIDVNGKLLGTGDAKIADYILALNNYLNAKNLLTQNNITRLQIINQINYWNR